MYGSPRNVADLISQKVRGLYGGGDGNAVGGEWEDLGLECSEAKTKEKSLSFREKVWAPARAVVSYFFRTPPTVVEAEPLSIEADPALEDSYNEWTVRVRCNPYSTTALSYPNSSSSPSSFSSPSSPSFTVYIFLDYIPTDPQTWNVSPQTAGKFHAFVNMAPELCSNCQRLIKDGKEIEGFVHLNRALVKRGVGTVGGEGIRRIEGRVERQGKDGKYKLEEGIVKPYLKEKLCWGAKKVRDSRYFPLYLLYNVV